jgi:hypothetical protein
MTLREARVCIGQIGDRGRAGLTYGSESLCFSLTFASTRPGPAGAARDPGGGPALPAARAGVRNMRSPSGRVPESVMVVPRAGPGGADLTICQSQALISTSRPGHVPRAGHRDRDREQGYLSAAGPVRLGLRLFRRSRS